MDSLRYDSEVVPVASQLLKEVREFFDIFTTFESADDILEEIKDIKEDTDKIAKSLYVLTQCHKPVVKHAQ